MVLDVRGNYSEFPNSCHKIKLALLKDILNMLANIDFS